MYSTSFIAGVLNIPNTLDSDQTCMDPKMKFVKRNIFKLCVCTLVLFTIVYFHLQMKSLTATVHSARQYALRNLNVLTNYTNIESLKFTYSSNLCLYTKPKIVLLVTSHIWNIDARNVIRQSRPKDLFKTFNAQMIFLLAVAENSSHARRQTENEFRQHGDMVQGDFVEAYHNLTFKHLMGYRWVRDYCSSAVYVVKMDDDIVLNYYKLFEIIKKFKSKFELLGHVIEHMKPIRDLDNKWYVSELEFKEEEYPPFLSGWVYVITTKAMNLILRESQNVPFFWIDDVFVTGVLRAKVGLPLTDIRRYFRYEPKNLECCILNKYSCDFLAAPNGKDFKLNSQFGNHLWRCRYKKVCLMESSLRTSCWSSVSSLSMKGQLISVIQKL